MLPNLDSWLACFERRAAHPPTIPVDLADHLSDIERQRIGRSLATFQLGEQSEGRTLRVLAQRYADRHRCPELVRITECFIREEQRHAATLASYMAAHGISRRTHDWSDAVFRRLRRLVNFELAIAVLVTAELMGIQFYRALLRSSGSRRLQATCSLFLQDEALHVAYESEMLLAMRARRGRVLGLAAALLHGAFHVVTAAVVWLAHRRVFRAAGYTGLGFLALCARQYALYLVPRREAGPKDVGGRPRPFEQTASGRATWVGPRRTVCGYEPAGSQRDLADVDGGGSSRHPDRVGPSRRARR